MSSFLSVNSTARTSESVRTVRGMAFESTVVKTRKNQTPGITLTAIRLGVPLQPVKALSQCLCRGCFPKFWSRPHLKSKPEWPVLDAFAFLELYI